MALVYSDVHPACQKSQIPCQKNRPPKCRWQHDCITIAFSDSGDILEFPAYHNFNSYRACPFWSKICSLRHMWMTGKTCFSPWLMNHCSIFTVTLKRNFLESEVDSGHLHNYLFKKKLCTLCSSWCPQESVFFRKKKKSEKFQGSYLCPQFQTNLYKSFNSPCKRKIGFFLFPDWRQLWHMWMCHRTGPIEAIFMTFPFWNSQEEKKQAYWLN